MEDHRAGPSIDLRAVALTWKKKKPRSASRPTCRGFLFFRTVRPPPTWFADHWGEGDLFARNPKGPLPSGERQIVPPQWGDDAAPKRQRQQSWGDNEGAWYGMAQSFRVDGTGDHLLGAFCRCSLQRCLAAKLLPIAFPHLTRHCIGHRIFSSWSRSRSITTKAQVSLRLIFSPALGVVANDKARELGWIV